MKFEIKYLESAIEDLKSIQDWIEIQVDKEMAMKIVNSIVNSIDRLAMFPNSGSFLPDDLLKKSGYKILICKKYIVIYRLINDVVYIYHIAHGQTRYSRLFKGM